jgi:hypothetical protein
VIDGYPDTLTMVLAGGPSAPYHGSLMCRGCGGHIGLYNRDGQLVAMQYHQARVEELSSELIGWGSSGFGMWRVRRGWVCNGGR